MRTGTRGSPSCKRPSGPLALKRTTQSRTTNQDTGRDDHNEKRQALDGEKPSAHLRGVTPVHNNTRAIDRACGDAPPALHGSTAFAGTCWPTKHRAQAADCEWQNIKCRMLEQRPQTNQRGSCHAPNVACRFGRGARRSHRPGFRRLEMALRPRAWRATTWRWLHSLPWRRSRSSIWRSGHRR